MFLIRPIKDSDLDGLLELLQDSGHGLTSLPKDREILAKKIEHCNRSFEHRGDRPAGELYLFVMEEVYTGKLVGISGIISKIGGFEPYYFYRLKSETRKSELLNIEKEVKSLHMERTHSGPAEICSLFLSPEFRNAQNGRLLSLSRFLFMAENEKYFEKNVIAEMRGQVDETGHSPFWNAVGQKFMDIDFIQADCLTLKSKSFIEELLPDIPILIDLLPKEAQDVVAEVHENTRPAKRILEQEGFDFNGLVGIFEPGPVLEAELKNIRSFKESKVIEIEDITQDEIDSNSFIISTTSEKKFKATLGPVKILETGKAQINAVTATALKLKVGERLRFTSLKSSLADQVQLEI